MKCELHFRLSASALISVNGVGGKEKEKDLRTFVAGVEVKTDKEFVVLTSGKSQCYTALEASVSSTWVEKIRASLESHQ